MPPLARQQSRTSIHSWWSDNNPRLQGPTINLHAVTKPLLRRMYHRQALSFIKKTRGAPLSDETVQIFASYLPWNYVASSTKAAILIELMERVNSEDDAHLIGHSFLSTWGPELLASSNPKLIEGLCWLVEVLARYKPVVATIIASRVCWQLTSLLRDGTNKVVWMAAHTLADIAWWQDGAEAVVDAKAPDFLQELLDSSDADIREVSCQLVGNLACHEVSMPHILESTARKLCMKLVSLLRDSASEVIKKAAHALADIARWPDGSRAVVDAQVLDFLQELLESSDMDVRRVSCRLVGNLASHEVAVGSSLLTEFLSGVKGT